MHSLEFGGTANTSAVAGDDEVIEFLQFQPFPIGEVGDKWVQHLRRVDAGGEMQVTKVQ
ncbi:MAG: hypothetical protein BWZ07_03132 [Alphaproteobacteria bacterium ADurb.BinA280]|nr:MAG: hypothetical protein BWZ07_03132 [Alphaproteobacteria bacterium ADurb.BinA280]